MYLFRQFWAIFWLADFFQNRAVSRASVNRTCQKGPHLPQSFSTEVAIESGLYIGPGIGFLAGPSPNPGPIQDLAKMSVLSRSELGPGSGSDSQNPGPNQNLARMAVLAKSWFGPGFWLRSMVGPESWNLDKIATLLKSRDSVRFPDFWIRSWILPDPIPDPYMSTLVRRITYRCWKLHTTPCTCRMSATFVPHVHIQIVSKANSCTCTFWYIRHFLSQMIVFDHSCALKIIFGIIEPPWDAFPGVVVYVGLLMCRSPSFLPHNASDNNKPIRYAHPRWGRAYAVKSWHL